MPRDVENLSLNVEFYTLMKRIFSSDFNLIKIKDPLLDCFRKNSNKSLIENKDLFLQCLESNLSNSKKAEKIEEYTRLANLWESKNSIDLFRLALLLNSVKIGISEKVKNTLSKKSYFGDKLSLVYDSQSCNSAYEARILTSILSKTILLNLQNQKLPNYIKIDNNRKKELFQLVKKYSKKVDIFSCFLPIMIESVNQSIISNAGGSYEDRVLEKLISIGIPKSDIVQYKHSEVGSIEHDFIFKYKNKKWGISSKRTLRERYKQYVNLLENNETDFMFAITLGTDLTPSKAKTIVSFGVKIFVAPEIYKNNKDLQKIKGLYSTTQLTKKTLDKLIKELI
ncbi:MAG: hypothetical protein ACOX1V_00905 [Candidatus Iainarchaeum sp.]|jgi:hypothetical protein